MRYLLLYFLICFSSSALALDLTIANKAKYDVTYAQTNTELKKGLMFVKNLPQHQGMLFDLRKHPNTAMWMKNTYIPLDMLFINCERQIVDIKENCSPHSLERIISSKPFCYVLEINSGEVTDKNLKIGDIINF